MAEKLKSEITLWTWIVKFLRLFVLIYFLIYMFPFPLTDIPVIGEVLFYYYDVIDFLTVWLGKNVLRLSSVEVIEMTGSGDTTYDYIETLSLAIISLFVSIVVFAFTAKRSNYEKLHYALMTYARYYLALYLLSYGFTKFFEGQFIYPDIVQLEQKIGDSSPMGLLWKFMGYSKPYTFFSGICEVAAGLFLFFNRTSVIGSLLSIVVMTNVVLLNFAYDVPVKLLSLHLLALSFFIISPNLLNLFHFFFSNKTAMFKVEKLELENKWLRYGRIAVKAIVVIGFPAMYVFTFTSYMEGKVGNHLTAAYTTQEFTVNNDTLSACEKEDVRWNKFILEDSYAKIIFENEKSLYYKLTVDTTLQVVNLIPYKDTSVTYTLNYNFITDKLFSLSGQFRSDSISATFKVKRKEEYELLKRGFNWVQEYPYNR